MTLQQLCQILNDSTIGTSVRESTYTFPLIETAHVLGIALLVGTVAVLDLRLLGLALRRTRVTELANELLPLTWMGFALMFATGFILFMAEAAKVYGNPAFRVKLFLLALVGLNPLLFHLTIYRRVGSWDTAEVTPLQARGTAIASLSLWAGIIVAGRAIAYFH